MFKPRRSCQVSTAGRPAVWPLGDVTYIPAARLFNPAMIKMFVLRGIISSAWIMFDFKMAPCQDSSTSSTKSRTSNRKKEKLKPHSLLLPYGTRRNNVWELDAPAEEDEADCRVSVPTRCRAATSKTATPVGLCQVLMVGDGWGQMVHVSLASASVAAGARCRVCDSHQNPDTEGGTAGRKSSWPLRRAFESILSVCQRLKLRQRDLKGAEVQLDPVCKDAVPQSRILSAALHYMAEECSPGRGRRGRARRSSYRFIKL